jgi:hypothetical protein
MRQFCQTFPIRNALRSELTWTGYRWLTRVEEPNRREFYYAANPNENIFLSRLKGARLSPFLFEP